jgi:hypothetical protein
MAPHDEEVRCRRERDRTAVAPCQKHHRRCQRRSTQPVNSSAPASSDENELATPTLQVGCGERHRITNYPRRDGTTATASSTCRPSSPAWHNSMRCCSRLRCQHVVSTRSLSSRHSSFAIGGPSTADHTDLNDLRRALAAKVNPFQPVRMSRSLLLLPDRALQDSTLSRVPFTPEEEIPTNPERS